MDNSIIVDILENFALALYAFPVVILGMWLSTKSWAFYSIAMVGFGWMAFALSGPVHEVWLNPDIGMAIKVMAWILLPFFFTILNLGSIVTIQTMRRQKSESNR